MSPHSLVLINTIILIITMDAIDITYLLFFFTTLFFSYLIYEIRELKKKFERIEKMYYELSYDLRIIRARYHIDNPYGEGKK